MAATTTETDERWKADVAKYIDALAEDVKTKAAEIERLRKQNDSLESSASDLLDERDRCERLLNQFAYTIAPQEVIGEHSSGNDPWENALDMLTSASQVSDLEAEVKRLRDQFSRARDALTEYGRNAMDVSGDLEDGINAEHLMARAESGGRH